MLGFEKEVAIITPFLQKARESQIKAKLIAAGKSAINLQFLHSCQQPPLPVFLSDFHYPLVLVLTYASVLPLPLLSVCPVSTPFSVLCSSAQEAFGAVTLLNGPVGTFCST